MRCGYVRDEDDDDGRKGRLHPECCNKLLDAEKRESPQAKGEEDRIGLLLLEHGSSESREARTERKKRRMREAVYECFNCHATGYAGRAPRSAKGLTTPNTCILDGHVSRCGARRASYRQLSCANPAAEIAAFITAGGFNLNLNDGIY
jgi:hypothetical protein